MKIAIAGYGAEGKANYAHWDMPENELTIVDERETLDGLPGDARTLLGASAFEKLTGFDLVVRTASLAPRKIKTDGKIWSATNEFFARCPAPIIGVTGTKGKGTTASILASILTAAGKTVHLVGNIGTPALDILPRITANDIVVFELSSFQLWDLKKSPEVSVILLIEADHLNIHEDFTEYVEAKANIRRYQAEGDLCVYHPTNEYSRHIAESSSKGKSIRYAIPTDGGVYVRDELFRQAEQTICSVDALQLLGEHNRENACAALTVAKFYDIADEAIEAGLRAFSGLPHRLEFVRELDGVRYYNDSFSSAPSATIAAIKSFTQPEILIIGGTDKGSDFTELVTAIEESNNIKTVVIIGEIRFKLAELLKPVAKNIEVFVSNEQTFAPIVELARSHSQSGDVIILSPACASFDMFKDFYDRGDQFRTIVSQL